MAPEAEGGAVATFDEPRGDSAAGGNAGEWTGTFASPGGEAAGDAEGEPATAARYLLRQSTAQGLHRAR
jgi:hypothetical protein